MSKHLRLVQFFIMVSVKRQKKVRTDWLVFSTRTNDCSRFQTGTPGEEELKRFLASTKGISSRICLGEVV
jgi:hypothetical protein